MAKTGLVLEGGAFRGVFTSGVLDVLMENGIEYDYVVGVSAGAGNGMGYITGQIGRTRNVIKPKDHKQNYFGLKQLFFNRKFLNLDKMFFEYPYKQFPYNFDKFRKSQIQLDVVVANCDTGEAEYYDEREDIDRFLQLGKASCSVPLMCAPVQIGDYHYLDGSICDSIPVQRALDQGCDRLVVVMTKSVTETPTNYGKAKAVMAAMYRRKFPKFYDALLNRTAVYKKELELLNKLEKEGKAIVIRPDIECIHKFEQDDEKVEEFYQNGRKVAMDKIKILKKFVNRDEELLKVSGGRE